MSNNFYFTPGPAQLYPTVAKHLQTALEEDIPSLSHRSSGYAAIQKGVNDKLKLLLSIPDDYVMFIGGSATFFMEKIVQNLVEQNSFHLVNGSFSQKFQQIASEIGKKAEQHKVTMSEGFDSKNIEVPQDAELITFTACETSTGVEISQDLIYQLARQHPDTLIAVDAVSALPYYQLDYSYVDAMFFSVQKGFGLPAGLGICFCSPRAIEKSRQLKAKGICIGSYHAFPAALKDAQAYQTPETPNVLDMYLLDQVLEDILDIGIDRIISETETKAKMIYDFFEKTSGFTPFVKNPADRSQTVAVIEHENTKELIEKLKKQNLILGSGYGEMKDKQFRVANFPSIGQEKIALLLEKISQAV